SPVFHFWMRRKDPMTIKIHITLAEEMTEAKIEEVKQNIVATGHMTEVNEKRLHLYGILSGRIEPGSLEKIKKVKGVEAVEVDRKQST
ncbi:MAG: hypothetical protein AAGM67_18915, partial [Bacteroidota bacterium]